MGRDDVEKGPDRGRSVMGRPGEVFQSRTAPVVPPIYQASTFALDEVTYKDIQENDGLGEIWYTRFRNPTVDAAAVSIANLEGAEAAVMASSGMAAIATTILSVCETGSRVVSAREIYGDTRDLFVRDLPRLGIEVDFVNVTDIDGWERACAARATVVFAESLSNPQLHLLDVPAVAALAHDAGALFVVDNTFASPFVLQPLAHGADVVVHSVTKFLNGHSDVIAGCVASNEGLIGEVQRRIVTYGSCLDPHAAFLVFRGLKTFWVRLRSQTESAGKIAEFLMTRDDVARVVYPSLSNYTSREVADRLLRPGRTGAMVSFVVEGGDDRALEVMRRLRIPTEATSLGGVESLVSMPFNSSHFSLSPDERRLAGIDPGMIRLSVGLEDADELIDDLRDSLDATRR